MSHTQDGRNTLITIHHILVGTACEQVIDGRHKNLTNARNMQTYCSYSAYANDVRYLLESIFRVDRFYAAKPYQCPGRSRMRSA
jgi:hypothetical protein